MAISASFCNPGTSRQSAPAVRAFPTSARTDWVVEGSGSSSPVPAIPKILPYVAFGNGTLSVKRDFHLRPQVGRVVSWRDGGAGGAEIRMSERCRRRATSAATPLVGIGLSPAPFAVSRPPRVHASVRGQREAANIMPGPVRSRAPISQACSNASVRRRGNTRRLGDRAPVGTSDGRRLRARPKPSAFSPATGGAHAAAPERQAAPSVMGRCQSSAIFTPAPSGAGCRLARRRRRRRGDFIMSERCRRRATSAATPLVGIGLSPAPFAVSRAPRVRSVVSARLPTSCLVQCGPERPSHKRARTRAFGDEATLGVSGTASRWGLRTAGAFGRGRNLQRFRPRRAGRMRWLPSVRRRLPRPCA